MNEYHKNVKMCLSLPLLTRHRTYHYINGCFSNKQ